MEEIYHWSAGREEKEMGERVAFTARIPDGSEDRVIESLRIAYPILAEKVDLKDVQRFSVFHKDRCLYWYSEYFSGNGVEDSQTLPSDLKVEDELNWMPMKQVFYLA
jgi:hypothetical protein